MLTSVHVAVDYADMCWNSHWLRGHDVGVVIDYEDNGVGVVNKYVNTDKTMRTLSENFEGFSQILKEQSDEKWYLGVFTNSIEKFKNMKTLYLKKNLTTRTRDFRTVWLVIRKNENRES